MIAFAIFALIAWVPITVGLFTVMAPQKAATASLVGAWLLLPAHTIPLPGIPDYSKYTATTFGILIATCIFQLPRLLAVRPQWFDLPIIVYCLCPFAAAIANNDGAYDGLAQSLQQIFIWGLPYYVGRIYFGDMEGVQTLALGMIVGGLAYIPPCLWEMRMSPQLSKIIYGVGRSDIEIRMGGYRPKVFLWTGLELGMWMSASSLAAWWIWRSGSLKQMMGIPFGKILLPSLLITTILCKATGSLVLLSIGIVMLWGSVRFKTRALLLCILLIPLLYYTGRISGMWTGEGLHDFLTTWFDAERADSLDFRFRNENLLIERALERPIIGWGGWGKSLQISPEKLAAAKVLQAAVPDGLWIIVFGTTGYIGLAALTLVVLLPPILFISRIPTDEWLDPIVAPSAMFTALLSIYMLDCLANAMVNLVYIVAMGGLSAATLSYKRSRINRTLPAFVQRPSSLPDQVGTELAIEPELPSTISKLDHLARRHVALARSLALQGRRPEATAIWFQALDHWTRLTSTHPTIPGFRASRCDCCNDLAWFLLDDPNPTAEDVSQAVTLATEATNAFPDRWTYWNTLGTAYYRAGDNQSAIDALHRSLSLQDDCGTGFDYLYLAMACSRLEQYDIARSWYEKGLHWLDKHAHGDSKLTRLGHEAKESLMPEVGER